MPDASGWAEIMALHANISANAPKNFLDRNKELVDSVSAQVTAVRQVLMDAAAECLRRATAASIPKSQAILESGTHDDGPQVKVHLDSVQAAVLASSHIENFSSVSPPMAIAAFDRVQDKLREQVGMLGVHLSSRSLRIMSACLREACKAWETETSLRTRRPLRLAHLSVSCVSEVREMSSRGEPERVSQRDENEPWRRAMSQRDDTER